MGSWELVEGGGDPEMAVPGLASFLAFLSRPQTPRGLRWGRVSRQQGASWALTLSLPSPACLIHLTFHPPPPGA